LEESARLLYKEWFVNLRFPGHEHVKKVDGVPEGWVFEPLEKALILQRGFDLPVQDRVHGGVPIYASTGITGFHNTAPVKGPGIVTGRSGTLGVVTYAPTDYWPLNTALWVKEFKTVTPFYALFLLRDLGLEKYNGGVSVPTLDRKVVHKINVLIPSTNLLKQFNDFCDHIFSQINTLSTMNGTLKQARDLLLPKLISGEMTL